MKDMPPLALIDEARFLFLPSSLSSYPLTTRALYSIQHYVHGKTILKLLTLSDFVLYEGRLRAIYHCEEAK